MSKSELLEKMNDRSATAGVIGLGYVGLPLAMAYVAAGYRVLGFDTDPAKVEKLTAGESYIGDVGRDELKAATGSGLFTATADMARLAEPDVLVMCVPTPLTPQREPDMSYLSATAETVSGHLRPGQLVIVESTVYPGATRELVLPRLEASGLKHGADFWLAFSSERVDPGNKEYPLTKIPKVIGGIDTDGAELCTEFYRPVVVDVVPVSSAEAAEMSKLLENTYRAVNIALVNELKILCHKMGLDVFEVIEAAATKPYGYQPFWPGPGVGGHCIPLDPFYLSWKARDFEQGVRFVELAGELNWLMPQYVVERTAAALNARGKPMKGARVMVLGITYKADVEDMRESPALPIIERLLKAGAEVCYHDQYVPVIPPTRKYRFDLESVDLTPDIVEAQDAVVLVTDHTGVDYDTVLKHAKLFVDTRGLTRSLGWDGENVVRA
jgi:UDP-N-acetyl-D-glucosamine dehydrogenase